MTIRFLIAIISMALIFPNAGLAREASAPAEWLQGEVQLEELIVRARERNPALIAARADWLASRKRIAQAWSLPDPEAEFDVMGEMTETRVGPQESRFGFSQEVPNPLKLWERRKEAQEEAEAARQRYLAIERDVVRQLKRAFYDLYLVDASIKVIEEIHELLKNLEGVAQARYSNLGGSQRDVAKAQAEVSLTLEELFMLRQRRTSVRAFILALLDEDPLAVLGRAAKPAQPELAPSLVELLDLAEENRQEVKEMEAIVAQAKHAKRLAWLEYVPDINVGFMYTAVGSGFTTSSEDGKDSWMFPLRINIPLWQNRIVPGIQEAQKKLESARAKLLKARNETFYEVQDAHIRYETASQIALLYETAIIPQAKLALTSDQAGYEAGKTDFLNLLDSERIFLNAQLSSIKFYAEVLNSYADLERATGLDFAEVKP